MPEATIEPTISEIMTRTVETLHAGQSLLEAMQFFHENRIRHVPIMSDDQLVGVVTDRDIKRATPTALVPEQREVWESVVRDTILQRVMTRNPTTISPDARLRDALRLFVEEKIGCLPVVREGELVGIVTAQDLFRAMFAHLEGEGS